MTNKSRSIAKWSSAAVVMLIFIWLLGFCAPHITPTLRTVNTMVNVRYRISLYAEEKGKLPRGLDALPELPGKDNSILDAWGVPLKFTVDTSNIATISSLGADKVEGGEGENADIVKKFRVCFKKGCSEGEISPFLD